MPDFRFTEQKTATLRHSITDDIRKAIFGGKLKPGDRLREQEMSKQMGVSRGPIREAMRTLEQEGLLYSQPYKETMVAEITEEEAVEVLIPIRITIEQFAVQKALPHMQVEQFGRLRAIVEEMKEGAAQNNLAKVVDCDLAFHEYLVNQSKLTSLIGIWTSIYNRIRLYFLVQGQQYENLNELCRSHERLLQTFETGDLARISAALIEHISDRKSSPQA